MLTILVLGAIGVLFGLYHGAGLHYGDNPLMMDWDKEGPYIFYKSDSMLQVNYIKGNKDDGFYLVQKNYPLDSSSFDFSIKTDFETPMSTCNDNNKILAISDN